MFNYHFFLPCKKRGLATRPGEPIYYKKKKNKKQEKPKKEYLRKIQTPPEKRSYRTFRNQRVCLHKVYSLRFLRIGRDGRGKIQKTQRRNNCTLLILRLHAKQKPAL